MKNQLPKHNHFAIRKLTFIFSMAILSFCAQAQQNPSPIFTNGDRVCFVGNSITNNGEFYNFIYLFYATRFPDQKLSFFNCGISGDVSSGILRRMDDDVLSHNPTKVALMIGMNDVKRTLYTEHNRNNPLIDQQKAEALTTYRQKTEEIITIFKQHKLGIILLKPTIYDQTAKLPEENFFGVNDALKIAGEHIGNMAKKYDTRLVDFWTILNRINQELQVKDPSATITGKDRVHPGSPGHFVMAYQFLKTLQPNKYVANIVLTKTLAQSNQQSINCALSNLQVSNAGTISFSCLENSLPFVVTEAAEPALHLVPFMDDLNQEVFKTDFQQQGNYELAIDGQKVGIYTTTELKAGINLADNKFTPQYQQAVKVMELCQKIRSTQAKLRNIKFVEFLHLKDAPTGMNLTETEAFLNDRLEKQYPVKQHDYYQMQFSSYIKNKPEQEKYEKQVSALEDSVYQSNKPRLHHYLLTKK